LISSTTLLSGRLPAAVERETTVVMQYRLLTLACGLALAAAAGMSAETGLEDSMQKTRKFKKKINQTVSAEYLLFLPKDYDAKGDQRWPLLIFLHGAGERGADLKKVMAHGPPKVVESRPDFPFILVSPQCPEGEVWSDEVLLGLLDEVSRKHKVDTNRVYLTGLSMGGFGTWSLGAKHPERFAAIAPICGGGNTINVLLTSRENAAALKSLGVWAFHGAKDPVVKLEESERMIAAFKRAGVKDIKLTVYPEAQHDSWTETYNNDKLYEWLLKHEREPSPASKFPKVGSVDVE
jgi:predicted peptidase